MVSILVPVYNVAEYIERCARSLLEQTYADKEIIFVDDASPDESVEILERVIAEYPQMGERCRIIHHSENKGLAATRNTGYRAARGEYVLHVDSDDWIEIDAVESLIDVAEKDNADIVYSDFNEIKSSGQRILENPNIQDKEEYTKSLLRRKSLTHIIGKLIRSSVIKHNNLYAIEGINQGEDYLMTPKIAYYSRKVAKARKPMYNYNRMNIASYTANVSDAGIDSIITVQSKLNDFFSNIPDSKRYKQTLEESSVYNKLSCFYSGPYSSFDKISKLYEDVNWKKMNLKTKQKLVLSMSDLRMLRLLYIFVATAKKIM